MSTLHNVQILIEPEQYQALAEIARGEGRTISEVVRDIIHQYLSQRERAPDPEKGWQALEELTEIRHRIEARHGIITQELLA
jgi:metal-responsive CopG/Arc/MetJ family transcriptional regulator